jgi:hypothetical protein
MIVPSMADPRSGSVRRRNVEFTQLRNGFTPCEASIDVTVTWDTAMFPWAPERTTFSADGLVVQSDGRDLC